MRIDLINRAGDPAPLEEGVTRETAPPRGPMPRPWRGEIRLAEEGPRAYGNHMTKITELTVTRVGNSRGVRLPAEVLVSPLILSWSASL